MLQRVRVNKGGYTRGGFATRGVWADKQGGVPALQADLLITILMEDFFRYLQVFFINPVACVMSSPT